MWCSFFWSPVQMLEDRNPLSLVLDATSHSSAFVVARALGVNVSSAAMIVAESVVQLWRFSAGFSLSHVERSADSQQRPRGTVWGVLGLVFPRLPLSQRLRKPGAGYFWKGVTPGFCGILSGPCAFLQPL